MRINKFVSVLLVVCLTFNSFGVRSKAFAQQDKANTTNDINANYLKPIEPKGYIKQVKMVETVEQPVIIEQVAPVIEVDKLSQEEVDLISRVVMAEAENEPLEGKLYVVDTILNRVDSKSFPNTVHDVIYQAHQFTSMWNGRYNRCKSNSELNDMINAEYSNRKNSGIVFFTANRYGEYGSPSFRVANHYFSTYN